MEDIPYDIGSPELVQKLEAELKAELAELKSELEDSDIVHGMSRIASSVGGPKDLTHFRRERDKFFERTLQVCEAMPLVIQADQMLKELNSAHRSDYSAEALPLLLHQYFVDRMHQLVQCKYMHLLRWKRFLEHTKVIESLYTDFTQRINDIMAEYNDCVSRAQRLASVRELYLAGDSNAAMSVRVDDLLIYVRWLVSHLASMRKFHQYLKMLEWLPVVHRANASLNNAPTPKISTGFETFQSEMSKPTVNQSSSSIHVANSLSTNPIKRTGETVVTPECLPLHVNELKDIEAHLAALVAVYGIDMDVSTMTLSADEMELYSRVVHKFRAVFLRQEHMRNFKTYDVTDTQQQSWSSDSSIHAVKKPANWLPFITLKPERDPIQEHKLADLRSRKNVDLLLEAQAHFLRATDNEKVQDALRDHAASVREPVVIQPLNPTPQSTDNKSRHKVENTSAIWQKIYTNPELYKEQQKEELDMDECSGRDRFNARQVKSRSATARLGSSNRRNSFDFLNAVQLLGLEDGEQDSSDPGSMQGGYMAFLHLRHLHIRDLQRTCLSKLNYMRSVERTLTINDAGLTCQDASLHFIQKTPPNHRQGIVDGRIGGGSGIGSHHYIHNTPADYVMSETEFIEFNEVDNHDDFCTVDDDGRVSVQDQRGCHIVYDAAIDDFNTLEHDLLLITSHYIEKDKLKRSTCNIKRPTSARRQKQQAAEESSDSFTMSGYAHQEVDRFAVLHDLWTNEAAFLQCKHELIDCYFEAYHHVFDRDEKRRLAQIITNIAYSRPRFDFESDYFVRSYQLECHILRLHADIVKAVLNMQIVEQRHYIEKICRGDQLQFGLPYSIINKQPISITSNRASLVDVFMLEFHPSLAIASRIPAALTHAYHELCSIHKPCTVTEMLQLQKKTLECALSDWNKMPMLGASYAKQVQKDLFSGVFADDPLFVCEVAQSLLSNAEQQAGKKSQKDRQLATLNAVGQVLDIVTIRHRLIDAAWETEILSKVYKKQAVDLDFDECHLFLRSVQFEFAPFKDDAGKAPPIFMTAIQEDDSMIDRYMPTHLYLAISELDENHVGRFSFRTREGFLQLARDHRESLQVVLMTQVVHKNALVCAIQQVNVCHQVRDLAAKRSASTTDARGGKNMNLSPNMQLLSAPNINNSNVMGGPGNKLTTPLRQNYSVSPQAFVSLQLEKTPSRDLMLNDFFSKKTQMTTVLKNAEELEKLKRKLISEFCFRFHQRLSQYSLRAQIIAYYNSILRLLSDFPAVRDKYFMLGEANEKKDFDEETALEPDPRSFRKRVHSVMSEDGSRLFNVWFLPHHTEILVAYKRLGDVECSNALTNHLVIVAALHDILQYLCAHSRLGSAQARLGSRADSRVTADWGGASGIGTELSEIQKQIDNLSVKTDPELVGQLLSLRRDVLFLEFDIAVRHSVRDTFLATGNVPACKAVMECTHFALYNMSNSIKPSAMSTYLHVPEPLIATDSHAAVFYPWRAFISNNGPFPIQFWQWSLIEYNLQLCLSGLKDVDRQVANAEILSMSLLMEDVLLSGYIDKSVFIVSDDMDGGDNHMRRRGSVTPRIMSSASKQLSNRSLSSAALKQKLDLAAIPMNSPLSQLHQPLESYTLLKSFLLLWKRLEVLKQHWAFIKYGVAFISSYTMYTKYCKDYRKEVLFPVMQQIARRCGQAELYEGLINDLDPLVLPRGASEMEVKMRQVLKLLERLECHMVFSMKRKVQSDLSLALAERARDENTLPTDLWKKLGIRETFTINRPHITDNFISALMSNCSEDEAGNMSFSADHLSTCLSQLSSNIMAREKMAFESYSTYYENLLRANHQLLYQKEQEISQLRDQLQAAQNSVMVEVECQLADTSQQLLLEVTALRTKLADMKEERTRLESDVRSRVCEEYSGLIQGLFNTVFDLNHRFDQFKKDVCDGVFEKISETRSEAVGAMTRLAQRSGAVNDTEQTRRGLATAQQMRDLQHDKYCLDILLLKQQALSKWRLSYNKVFHEKKTAELKKKAERFKKEKIRGEMSFEREKQFLCEQLKAIRTALKTSQMECDTVKKELETELKEKTDQSHVSQQQALSLKKLEEARMERIKKLHADLEEKNDKLQQLTEEQEKIRQQQIIAQEKIKKDAEMIKKQLYHERNLKRDAFQRVEELQSEICETTTRPQTAFNSAARSSRVNSAVVRSCGGAQRAKSASWQRTVSLPRCLTAGASDLASRCQAQNNEIKKIQRPKTSNVSLRSRLAAQLLNDLEPPDHYEVLVKIGALSVDGKNIQQTDQNGVCAS